MKSIDTLPNIEDCEWIEQAFDNWKEAIRPFRELLYDKGWDGKVGEFEAEKAVDLKVLNKEVFKDETCSPVDALIGYKKRKALLVYISLYSEAHPSFVKNLKDCIDLSRNIIKKIDCGIKIHNTTVILLKDDYYNFNANLLIRKNPYQLYSLAPLTIDSFYQRFFDPGYRYKYVSGTGI